MSASKPNVLIRVNASKEAALGHLKRCLSLAYKMRENGIYVIFLVLKDDFTQRLLKELDFEYEVIDSAINSEDDCRALLDVAQGRNTGIVVIDSYEIDAEYRRRLMSRGLFVVSIDDTAGRDIPSYVIINSNLNAERIGYADSCTNMYLGIRYLILGPDFWDIDELRNTDDFKNVLITMGGIDHYDLTSKILCILEKIDAEFEITAIIGPYYENKDPIRRQADRLKKRIDLVESPRSLFPYMNKCSLALSAGGQTLYELAALGRPTIGIALWKNQAGNVRELSAVGAIKGIIYSDDTNFDENLAEATARLIFNKDERKNLSQKASSIVDGKGAERTTAAILKAYEKWR